MLFTNLHTQMSIYATPVSARCIEKIMTNLTSSVLQGHLGLWTVNHRQVYGESADSQLTKGRTRSEDLRTAQVDISSSV